MVIRPFGEHALLAEVASLGEVLDLHRRLRASRPPGVVDLVPAARTVLVRVDPRALSLAAARAWVEGADAAPLAAEVAAAETVDVPIVYDGEDLGDVASALAVSVDALVAQHSGASWTVAFTGFAPGFGYLVSDDWPYDVPRLESPRTRVPAGSVGLAGEFSGAYPRDTPGGWQLIGTTTATLFDPAAARSSLLRPGDLVRFRPARASVAAGDPAARLGEVEGRSSGGQAQHEEQRSLADASPDAAFTVLAAGPHTTVQDLGRPGHLAEGVAISGAADRGSLRIANRLVGNDEAAAALEITIGGFRATAHRDLWIAVTGAWGPLRIAGRAVDPFRSHPWPAGTDLEVAPYAAGVRGCLAVRGGIDAPAALGSRASDTLARLGPARLADGDSIAVGDHVAAPVPAVDVHPWGPPPAALAIPLSPGPRADWFSPQAYAQLFDAVWSVSADADRVGIRLDGPPLVRTHPGELPSEGMVPGAVQVPPNGLPVVLGPDGPVTGGYPVIAVVTDAGRDLLAQARPGSRVRFRPAR